MRRRKRSVASDEAASSSVHSPASSSANEVIVTVVAHMLAGLLYAVLSVSLSFLIVLSSNPRRRRGGVRSRASVLSSDPSVPLVAPAPYRSCLGPNPVRLDFGDLDQVCSDCHALFWYQERSGSLSEDGTPRYNLCCRGSRVCLPPIEDPPEPLASLLDPTNGPESVHFIASIRTYNSMFSFTSMGVRIDHQINAGPGPYVFRVSGQVCHRIGSLTPPESQRPSYAQLYFYDTSNEVQNRIASFPGDSIANKPREHIVAQLNDMLYQHNPIARGFRFVRDRLGSNLGDDFRICIPSSRRQQGVQYSALGADEVVGLVVGDFDDQHSRRDIIVQSRGGHLERINPLHKKYFALQYPLVHTRGEDSYTEHIQYDTSAASSSDVQRPHVTMLEYYRYRLHIRDNGGVTLFRCGRLFQQICVDMYACIEDARLTYLYHNQDSLRVDMIYTVEFQKRGLPHVHIVVWLADRHYLSTPSGVDSIISAELPDPSVDPEGYGAVSRFMIHGPCGAAQPSSPCMDDGKCKKYYPKEFASSTILTHDDFVRYKRRDLGVTVEKNGVVLDNRHVVPHNIKMLLKYDAHVNVERCHSTSMVKYLFKYLSKGHDRAVISVQSTAASSRTSTASNSASGPSTRQETAQEAVDEIRHYLDCSDFQELYEIAENDFFGFTKLMAWFELNKTDELARNLTYIEIPTKFTWKQDIKAWERRKQNRKRLARMLFVHPNVGELYYLRMLLNIVRGPTSFEEVRTIDGVLYSTYKEACDALGLLDNDNEWLYTLQQVAGSATSQEVRRLFVDILLYSEVTSALQLWDACWRLMGDDILYKIRHRYRIPEFNCSDLILKDHILYELEDMLLSRGRSLDFVKLPQPTEERIYQGNNTLMAQQLSYNTLQLRAQAPVLLSGLNNEQKDILYQILDSVHGRQGKQFFVYGPGGTGKTYLWSALTAKLRSEGKIVLTVASSGLSSLLLQGGVTAYSRFKIPIQLTEQSTYRTMRDLFRFRDPALAHAPFGGMTMVLGGDFRQTLPVVTHGTRYDTIAASIVHSYLWDRFIVLRLTENMRLTRCRDDPIRMGKIADFAEWLLAVGNGDLPAVSLDGAAEPEWIQIPDQFLINYIDDEEQAIINVIYGDLHSSPVYDDYLRQRAILPPKNSSVNSLNKKVLSQGFGSTLVRLRAVNGRRSRAAPPTRACLEILCDRTGIPCDRTALGEEEGKSPFSSLFYLLDLQGESLGGRMRRRRVEMMLSKAARGWCGRTGPLCGRTGAAGGGSGVGVGFGAPCGRTKGPCGRTKVIGPNLSHVHLFKAQNRPVRSHGRPVRSHRVI
ncbi:hypothetical protein LUZ61_005757 [Rhynchospora tenuis]|uniref:ATP-dependent DNA helicase n=1 Tax=Rhynchospora tenuis TaxID=198213 RepID=A0AAD5ZQA8_9POAL|nr:hypothetical protein LUZ61_005757 [Rhynchospora tenuis]